MRPLLFAVLAFALACVTACAADPAAIDFTGHYELVKSSKDAFSLDVQQKGKTASAGFSASHMDGSGAAPDGGGEGTVNAKGVLTFQWTDSFENGGNGILRQEGKLFRLSLNATKVEDPRALSLYGDLILKRTSAKAPASAH